MKRYVTAAILAIGCSSTSTVDRPSAGVFDGGLEHVVDSAILPTDAAPLTNFRESPGYQQCLKACYNNSLGSNGVLVYLECNVGCQIDFE